MAQDQPEVSQPQTELSAFRDVETITRRFVEYVDEQTAHSVHRGNEHSPFAPRTVELVESLRLMHERLDEARRTDEAPPATGGE